MASIWPATHYREQTGYATTNQNGLLSYKMQRRQTSRRVISSKIMTQMSQDSLLMRTVDEMMMRMVEKMLITRMVNDTVVSVFDIHRLIYMYIC